MLPVWWSVGPSHIPDTVSEKKEFKFRLRIADCEAFYDIQNAEDLAYFLDEFHMNTREFDLGYDIKNITLKSPYEGGRHLVDRLADFAVQKYNADHEPLLLKSIRRVFSFHYSHKTKPGSLWGAFFISFKAEDKAGTRNLYHANVLTSEGLENILLDFRVSRFFPGEFVERENPYVLDLYREKRIYVEPDISLKVLNWSEKAVQLITKPERRDVTGNTGSPNGTVLGSDELSKKRKKRKRKQGKSQVSKE